MKSLAKLIVSTTVMAGAAALISDSASAQVNIGIRLPGVHIGVEAPAYYYGTGYYPPGPCDAYTSYYEGDCGYAVYNGPVVINGVTVGGPHYYRWFNGRPLFWYRGDWHPWAGWTRVNFGWNRGEGWGWHGGRWDRKWGDDHRGPDFREVKERREEQRDRREDRREDRERHEGRDRH